MNTDQGHTPGTRSLAAAEIHITQAMIDGYAAISGDYNPIHVDPEFAAATPFGGTIAHGCIPMEPIFKALQSLLGLPTLPRGTAMKLRYLRPSRPGDIVRLEAGGEGEDGSLAFACVNQRGEKVLEGSCTLPA